MVQAYGRSTARIIPRLLTAALVAGCAAEAPRSGTAADAAAEVAPGPDTSLDGGADSAGPGDTATPDGQLPDATDWDSSGLADAPSGDAHTVLGDSTTPPDAGPDAAPLVDAALPGDTPPGDGGGPTPDAVATPDASDADGAIPAPEPPGPIHSFRIEPDVVFLGETSPVQLTAGATWDPLAAVTTLVVERLDADGNVVAEEGALSDSGDPEAGDEHAGDGAFAGRLTFTADDEGTIRLRLRMDLPEGPVWSDEAAILLRERPTAQHLQDATQAQDQACAAFLEAMAAGATRQAAIDDAVAVLESIPGVSWVSQVEGTYRVSATFEPGIAGALDFGPDDTRGGCEPKSTPAPAPGAIEADRVGYRRAVLHAPLPDWPHNIGDELDTTQGLLDASACPPYATKRLKAKYVTPEAFRNLDKYGIIQIASHGGTVLVGPEKKPVFAVVTSAEVTAESAEHHDWDLAAHRLVLVRTPKDGVSRYAVTTDYMITYLHGPFPRSLILMGTCSSTALPETAQTFLAHGAAVFLGFDNVVGNAFAEVASEGFFNAWFESPSVTAGQAFVPGQLDPGWCKHADGFGKLPGCVCPPADAACEEARALNQSAFTMVGSADLYKPSAALLNGTFEEGRFGNWDRGWAPHIADWGTNGTTEGDCSLLLTTADWKKVDLAEGTTTTTKVSLSHVDQDFCLPPEAKAIAFDWRFGSEDCPLPDDGEYDRFYISIFVKGASPGIVKVPIEVTLKELCEELTMDLGFGDVRFGPWHSEYVDLTDVVPDMVGKTLHIMAYAVSGDKIGAPTPEGTSMVFLDNLRILE